MILSLVLAASLTVALDLPDPARLLTLIPFALLAPGVAVARLARLDSRSAELALGLVLSVGISGLVAGVLLGVGMWDPPRAVVILALGTMVALELDRRIPSRSIVWRDCWNAAHTRAPRLARALRSRLDMVARTGGAPPPAAPRGGDPAGARPLAHPSPRVAEPLPPPPVAVVRRGPRRAPVAVQRTKQAGKRQTLGDSALETPAISRHLRSTLDGVIDDLAARKDVPSS